VDNKLISVAVERIIRTFESMFGGRSQEEAVVVARNLRDRILMLNSILT
jgi:hypothetical protein